MDPRPSCFQRQDAKAQSVLRFFFFIPVSGGRRFMDPPVKPEDDYERGHASSLPPPHCHPHPPFVLPAPHLSSPRRRGSGCPHKAGMTISEFQPNPPHPSHPAPPLSSPRRRGSIGPFRSSRIQRQDAKRFAIFFPCLSGGRRFMDPPVKPEDDYERAHPPHPRADPGFMKPPHPSHPGLDPGSMDPDFRQDAGISSFPRGSGEGLCPLTPSCRTRRRR